MRRLIRSITDDTPSVKFAALSRGPDGLFTLYRVDISLTNHRLGRQRPPDDDRRPEYFFVAFGFRSRAEEIGEHENALRKIQRDTAHRFARTICGVVSQQRVSPRRARPPVADAIRNQAERPRIFGETFKRIVRDLSGTGSTAAARGAFPLPRGITAHSILEDWAAAADAHACPRGCPKRRPVCCSFPRPRTENPTRD